MRILPTSSVIHLKKAFLKKMLPINKYTIVSSANNAECKREETLGRSFVNAKKSKGPKCYPKEHHD